MTYEAVESARHQDPLYVSGMCWRRKFLGHSVLRLVHHGTCFKLAGGLNKL